MDFDICILHFEFSQHSPGIIVIEGLMTFVYRYHLYDCYRFQFLTHVQRLIQ